MLLGYDRLRVPKLISRRSFGKLLTAAPLARALAPFAQASSDAHNMFLSLNSVLLQGRVPWPDFARLAAKTGFPATDIMLRPAMLAGVSATNDLLASLKIKPAVIEFPVDFRKDDATFKTSLAQLDAAAQFAAAIHCPRMMTYILSSSDTPKDELRQTYKQRFTESARILARSNVRLGLEFLGPLEIRKAHKYEFIWRMNDMLAFAKECGPNVGLLLDSWHWHHAGATPADIVAAGRDRIVHVHFNDAPNLPPEQIHDNQRLLPGEGVINLTGFLQALQKIGYDDALSVEVFGRTKDMTPEAAAKAGLDSALAVFRKAGVPEGGS
jgi:sugar phosphate isomerase/epimerase